MITRNSLSKCGRLLSDVLTSVAREIPYEIFILGDADSKDGTPNFIRSFQDKIGKSFILVDGGRTRAIGRQKVIEKFLEFDAEWLLFADDDAEFRQGWFEEAKQQMHLSKVGLMWGINWDATAERRQWLESLGVNYRDYLVEQFWKRGGMHDTLLRREAIMDIRIPPFLHIYEDYWILKHVLERGYEAKILESGVVHSNPSAISTSDLKMMAKLAKSLELERSSIFHLFRTFSGLPLNIWNSVKGGLGVRRGIIRWRDKVLFRVYLLFETPFDLSMYSASHEPKK